MKIKLCGDISGIADGLQALCNDLGIETAETGFGIEAVCRQGPTEIKKCAEKAVISYEEPCHFYRALAILLSRFDEEEFSYTEKVRIKRTGLSLDVSRNAAPTVATIKHFIRKAALSGMNVIMLYMEDMYPLENEPKFGYMRGGYSESELREIDGYAAILGIELVPYIQTLAHLSQVLRWDEYDELRDTGDILLAESDATYDFLEKIIKILAGIFRSKRINLGMDEAHDLGLGKYKTLHGYRSGREILADHLKRVAGIAEKYSLRGIIASDMLFADENAAPIELPDNIDLMYWDYDRTNVTEISALIERHKAWGRTPMYLGTVRTWESFGTAYKHSFANIDAAIEACVQEGVEEAVISVWMNDGAENSLLACVPGMAYLCGRVFAPNMSADNFRRLFRVQTNADYDSFMLLDEIDALKVNGNCAESNASKYLMWQDVLLGLFDRHAAETDADVHYAKLAERLFAAAEEAGEYELLLKMMAKVCSTLEIKAKIGVNIRNAYICGRKEELADIAGCVIPELLDKAEAAREASMELWMATVKPFGFELLDARYGALAARLKTAKTRIEKYLNGEVCALPEIEQERQYFTKDGSLPTVLTYDRMLSVGHQGGPTR